MSTPTPFGTLLTEYRKRAAKAGVTIPPYDMPAGYLLDLEHGRREPSRDTVAAIARAFDLTTSDVNRLFVAAGYVPPGSWAVVNDYLVKTNDAGIDATDG